MDKEKIVKSTEEQAAASWISYLNQLRVDQMTDKLREQEQNLGDALSEIDKTLREVDSLITSNRGGSNGLHGFIAEAAEVGIENA
ncbi:MAG: hypothetical protein LUE92_16415 [Clostridiales bacterium]|nr:hypothetical protein [Clostridiales bacterium]